MRDGNCQVQVQHTVPPASWHKHCLAGSLQHAQGGSRMHGAAQVMVLHPAKPEQPGSPPAALQAQGLLTAAVNRGSKSMLGTCSKVLAVPGH